MMYITTVENIHLKFAVFHAICGIHNMLGEKK